MSYRIGSFNMYKYQTYRSDDEIKKNLDEIANFIIEESFDIVALQEIFSEMAMKNLLIRLGANWTGKWDSPNSYSAQAAEGYAFIWNTNRIRLAESQTVSGKRVYYPRIYNQYRVDRNSGQRELIRNPFFARFNPINTFFEIRLINVHIMFSTSANAENSLLSDAKMRKKEFEILVNNIYAKEADKRYGNNMPAYTIILGDYNLNLKRDWTKGPFVEEVVEINDEREIKKVRTVQDQLTTLQGKSKQDPSVKITGFANNYDHFSYDENRFSGTTIGCESIDTVTKYMEGDYEKHRKEISDHIPIVMNFNLSS